MLTAYGLIALADRVLTGAEATRVLGYAKGHLEGEEEFKWMDLLTDLDSLQEHFATLTTPTGNTKRILERLWAIALVDGEASMAEVRMLERIGRKLGAKGPEINTWRKTWTNQVIEEGSFIAHFMSIIIPGTGADIRAEDLAYYEQLIDGLPINLARRKRLLRLLDRPHTIEKLKTEFQALDDERQRELAQAIARQLEKSVHREAATPVLLDLAASAGLSEQDLAPAESAS
jgi:hypothetical protein